MFKSKKTGVLIAGTLASLVLGGSLTAYAASGDSSSTGSGISRIFGHGPHEHTAVTGDELTQVTDAVVAKVLGATVTKVEADPDGSYDVALTTSDGTAKMYDVSADLATITERTGGPGGHGGPRGMAMHDHTAVSGDELTKVTDAVVAKVPGATVTKVEADPDGSYDVALTTSDGTQKMYDASADLATITERTGGPGRGGPADNGATPPSGAPTIAPKPSTSANPSASTKPSSTQSTTQAQRAKKAAAKKKAQAAKQAAQRATANQSAA